MRNTDGSAFVNILVDMTNRKVSVTTKDDLETKKNFIKSIKREYKLLKNYLSFVNLESLENKEKLQRVLISMLYR